jgi:hypothetical protein
MCPVTIGGGRLAPLALSEQLLSSNGAIVQAAGTGINYRWRSKWRQAQDFNAKWHQSVKVLIGEVDHGGRVRRSLKRGFVK